MPTLIELTNADLVTELTNTDLTGVTGISN